MYKKFVFKIERRKNGNKVICTENDKTDLKALKNTITNVRKDKNKKTECTELQNISTAKDIKPTDEVIVNKINSKSRKNRRNTLCAKKDQWIPLKTTEKEKTCYYVNSLGMTPRLTLTERLYTSNTRWAMFWVKF